MRKEIVLTIASDGELTIETKGYAGKACLEESQFLKDLLGKELAVQLVPAFYQKNKETVKRHLPICG